MLATATDDLIDFMDTEIEAVLRQVQKVKQDLESWIDEAEKCSNVRATVSETTMKTTAMSY
jgi:hypothetical protein